MNLTYVRLLEQERKLYRLPRDYNRFNAYQLDLVEQWAARYGPRDWRASIPHDRRRVPTIGAESSRSDRGCPHGPSRFSCSRENLRHTLAG